MVLSLGYKCYKKADCVENLKIGSRYPKTMFLAQRTFIYPRGTKGRGGAKERRDGRGARGGDKEGGADGGQTGGRKGKAREGWGMQRNQGRRVDKERRGGRGEDEKRREKRL